MKISVDHTELITLLENNGNITEAILKVAQIAGSGNLIGTLDAMIRSHELILQALKSNTSIINQIKERNLTNE